MTTAIRRIFNFSAGPAVLPLPVLEEAQRDLVALPGVGMSVTEISHRSKTFESLLGGAIDDIRTLASVPRNYRILMLQGGAEEFATSAPWIAIFPGLAIVLSVLGINLIGDALRDHLDPKLRKQ